MHRIYFGLHHVKVVCCVDACSILYHLGPKNRNNLYNCYSEIRLSIDTALLDLTMLFVFAKMLCPQQEGPSRKCCKAVFFVANSFFRMETTRNECKC